MTRRSVTGFEHWVTLTLKKTIDCVRVGFGFVWLHSGSQKSLITPRDPHNGRSPCALHSLHNPLLHLCLQSSFGALSQYLRPYYPYFWVDSGSPSKTVFLQSKNWLPYVWVNCAKMTDCWNRQYILQWSLMLPKRGKYIRSKAFRFV